MLFFQFVFTIVAAVHDSVLVSAVGVYCCSLLLLSVLDPVVVVIFIVFNFSYTSLSLLLLILILLL